jgi:hypothetical protein
MLNTAALTNEEEQEVAARSDAARSTRLDWNMASQPRRTMWRQKRLPSPSPTFLFLFLFLFLLSLSIHYRGQYSW